MKAAIFKKGSALMALVMLVSLLLPTLASAAAMQGCPGLPGCPGFPGLPPTLTFNQSNFSVQTGSTVSTGVHEINFMGFPGQTLTSGVTYSSGDPNIATVNTTTGVVTGIAAGVVQITATYYDSGYGSNVIGTVNVTVTVPTLTGIGFNQPISVQAGSTVSTVVYATYSDGTKPTVTSGVTYSSGDPNIATVNSATGVVTGIAAGITVITATYQGQTATVDVTVTAMVDVNVTAPTLTGIGFNPSSYSVQAGSTVSTVVYATYSDGTKPALTSGVTYSGTNSIATVNSTTGVITGIAAGTTVITATYQGQTATVDVTVTVTAPTLTGIGFNPSSYSVQAGSTVSTVVYATNSDGTKLTLTSGVTYSSGTTSIATVNSTTGVITGIAAGTTVITATYQSKSATVNVTVTTPTTDGTTPRTTTETLTTDSNGNVDSTVLTSAFTNATAVTVTMTGNTAFLPVSALIDAAKKDGAAVTVKSDLGTYVLPLSVLKLDDLAKSLGVNVLDLSISVTAKKVTGDTATAIGTTAGAKGGKLLTDAVDFNVLAQSKDGKSINVSFGNTYVSRTLNVQGNVDVSNTTGVLYDPVTKTFSFVPSTFDVVNGVTVATLKRNGNSIYTVASFTKSFSDIADHWAKADIQLLANKLVIDGITDTTFAPNSNITRAQFAALVVHALGLSVDASATASFGDVKSSDWYNGAVAAAAKVGLIKGYEDGTFRPNQQITREELAALVVRALKYAGVKTDVSAEQQARLFAKYSDVKHIVWAQAEIAAAINAGIISGETDITIGPDMNATRAESATMLKRFLGKAGFIN